MTFFAAGDAREPEIGELCTSAFQQKDIAGLHVPVHDAVVLGVFERRRDLAHDGRCVRPPQSPALAQHLIQRRAVDENSMMK